MFRGTVKSLEEAISRASSLAGMHDEHLGAVTRVLSGTNAAGADLLCDGIGAAFTRGEEERGNERAPDT